MQFSKSLKLCLFFLVSFVPGVSFAQSVDDCTLNGSFFLGESRCCFGSVPTLLVDREIYCEETSERFDLSESLLAFHVGKIRGTTRGNDRRGRPIKVQFELGAGSSLIRGTTVSILRASYFSDSGWSLFRQIGYFTNKLQQQEGRYKLQGVSDLGPQEIAVKYKKRTNSFRFLFKDRLPSGTGAKQSAYIVSISNNDATLADPSTLAVSSVRRERGRTPSSEALNVQFALTSPRAAFAAGMEITEPAAVFALGDTESNGCEYIDDPKPKKAHCRKKGLSCDKKDGKERGCCQPRDTDGELKGDCVCMNKDDMNGGDGGGKNNNDACNPSPTPTETPTPTATPTQSPTPSATPEPTSTATAEPTATVTPEPTATQTATPSITPEPDPTSTATVIPTFTPDPEPTSTVTVIPTMTPDPDPSATPTVV